MVYRKLSYRGFTIVELLVVIVVIGILAAITIVSYSGITNKANIASLSSDLTNASTQLKMFNVDNSNYPTTISTDCANYPDSATNKCIKLSSNTTYSYKASPTSHNFFCLEVTKSSNTYNITQEGQLLAGPCPVLNLDASNSLSYPGNDTIWKDLSGNGNNGTLNGGVTYLPNTNGGVMSFDGGSGYVDVGTGSNLNFGTGDFSVSFWCYRTASGYQDGSYVEKGRTGSPGFDAYDSMFRVDTVNGNLASIGLSASYNVWENHVFVINQTTSPYIKHYINGVLNQTGYAESGYTGSVNNAISLKIGVSNAGGISRYFNGSMGNVGIYNVVLDANNILQNFNTLRSRYGI